MTPARRITIAVAAALGALALLALPSVAAAKDRNHDRIPDRWEKRHRLALNVNQAHRDQDHDHLRNRTEFLAGDNPRSADSDGDGIPDGEENAGTIQSFDAKSGKLTIALFGGETLTGIVNEETEIKCPPSEESTASASHEGMNESGESSNEEESGDDQGDHSSPDSPNSSPGDEGEQGDCNHGNCTTASLVPGATVEEADLHLANGVATFEEIDLGS